MRRDALLLAAAALAAFSFGACSTSMAQDSKAESDSKANKGQRPVLVELFTSQGCSSCPPADAVLTRLGERPGQQVIPLAFHVDYWDYIGWKDPFASPKWSNRQRAYAKAMKSTRIYTPQLVVDGDHHLVGSNRSGVDDAIEEAMGRSSLGAIAVDASPLAAGKSKKLKVSVTVKLPVGGKIAPHDLMVALFENDVETRVTRGENTGEKLHNDHIVRRLDKACVVKMAGESSCEVIFDLDKGWDADKLGAAAFLQHPRTMHIRAAGVDAP